MNILKSRRSKIITAAAVGLTLGFSMFASAYWSGGGSGTGGATTASVAPPINVSVIATGADMTPGHGGKDLSGTFTIPDNAEPVWVTSLNVVVDPTWAGSRTDTTKPVCSAADFVIFATEGGDLPLLIGAKVTTGTTWSGAFIAMKYSDTANQDNCKGVTVPLKVTAS